MSEHSAHDETQLSPEDLRDTVPAFSATTQPEAIYLTESLHEAGIPAYALPQRLEGIAMGLLIHVPRARLDEAQKVIAQARAEAEARGVEAAFDLQSVADTTDDRHDELLMAMFRLRAETPEERDEKLREHAAKWVLDSMAPVQMAKCLAAAGLSRAEAEALVNEMADTQREAHAERNARRATLGTVFFVLALLLAAFVAFGSDPTCRAAAIYAALAAFIAGLVMRHRAREEMPTLPRQEGGDTAEGQ
ncbi:MAG: hypothetical protein NTW87_33520 [Planctomycetota bacterium]|nr:hypothetical protein [Planctomycetota bacterium]